MGRVRQVAQKKSARRVKEGGGGFAVWEFWFSPDERDKFIEAQINCIFIEASDS